MDDGFSWLAELKDGMSKPAREGKAALHGLGDEIKKTEAELRKLQLLQLQYREKGGNWKGIASQVGIEASRVKMHLADLNKAHKGSMNIERGFFKEFAGSLVPQIAIGELLAEGVKKIGEGIGELVKFSVEVAEFKENTVSAYEVLGKGGQAMFAEIDALAHNIHMPAQEAHRLAQDLLTRGMEDDKMIAATIGAISAAKRGGPAGASEKIQQIIERSLSMGALAVRSPRELAGAGINVEALYADLGKRLGKSRDEIKAELKAGAIDAKVGIAAIDDAINTGKVGEIAKKRLTFGDLITDLKNNVAAIFQDVDTGPLVTGFRDFVDLFDPAGADARGLKSGMQELVDVMASVEDYGVLAFVRLQIAIDKAYIAIAPLIRGVEKLSNFLGGLGAGATIDRAAKMRQLDIEHFGSSNIRPGAVGAGGPSDFGGDFAAPPIAKDFGGDFDAGMQAGKDHIAGFKEGAGVHSPSREMAKIGEHLSEGLSIGMGGPLNLQPSGGGSSGTSVTVDVGGIVIHAMNGEEIAPLLESQVVDIFERVRLELGG